MVFPNQLQTDFPIRFRDSAEAGRHRGDSLMPTTSPLFGLSTQGSGASPTDSSIQRNFTAKTAKNAKHIAMAIALLTHHTNT